MASRPVPTPSLVVLVGAPASGKSHWAAENFRADQVVSADTLRAVVGEHELDLDATADAFDLLDRIVAARLGRGLTTVVDTTGLDPVRRRGYLDAARDAGVDAVAVRFATPAAECRRRNRARRHPVPTRALDAMLARFREIDLGDEGWDLVLEPGPVRTVTARLSAPVAAGASGAAVPPVGPPSGLRIGLLVSSFDWPGGPTQIAPTLRRIAIDAEAAGVDSLWVMDHLVQIPQVGRRWDPMLDAYGALAHVAAVTSRIRLGVLVSPVTGYPVARLAKLIATLDVVSGGRALAGIGAGSSEAEHRALGIAFGSPTERLRLLEDVVRALPILLGPGGKPFSGRVVSIPDTSLYPRPIQDRVPIIVGGSGEQVTLRIAARYADGCNLFGDPDTVARRVAVLRRHCEAAGRDPERVEVTHLGTALVGHDPADLRTRIERLRPPTVGPDRYAESVNAGTVDDHLVGFGLLADAGVETAVVTIPGLDHEDALAPVAALVSRLRTRDP